MPDFRSERGTRLLTRRYENVTTAGQAISFPIPVNEIIVHIEGATVVGHITGNVTFTGSGIFYLTSDGTSYPLPVGGMSDNTICTVAAPADTIDVSVMAWAT